LIDYIKGLLIWIYQFSLKLIWNLFSDFLSLPKVIQKPLCILCQISWNITLILIYILCGSLFAQNFPSFILIWLSTLIDFFFSMFIVLLLICRLAWLWCSCSDSHLRYYTCYFNNYFIHLAKSFESFMLFFAFWNTIVIFIIFL